MSDTSPVCKQNLGDKYAVCDSCHSVQHPVESCTGLSSSELRAVVLSKRTLVYFCQECRISFKSIPTLLTEIRNFKSEVISLKQEMNTLKAEVTSLMTENSTLKIEINSLKYEGRHRKENDFSEVASNESVIMELLERQKRESNIMIANVCESQEVTPLQRKEDDTKIVRDLLQNHSVNLDNITIFRVGKVLPNKNRLIKVIMQNKSDAITVFRIKK